MNLSQVLKAEILRLSRKEVKAAISKVHKPTVQLKHAVAALKRSVDRLAKENKRLQGVLDKLVKNNPALITPPPEKSNKARITGKGMKSLRKKLRLTQAQFGKLLGVSSQAVVNWEKKNGALKVRGNTKAAVLAIRGIGAREAKNRVEGMKA